MSTIIWLGFIQTLWTEKKWKQRALKNGVKNLFSDTLSGTEKQADTSCKKRGKELKNWGENRAKNDFKKGFWGIFLGEPFQTLRPEPDGIAMPTFFEGYVVLYYRTPSRVGNIVSSRKERETCSDNRKEFSPKKHKILLYTILPFSIRKVWEMRFTSP